MMPSGGTVPQAEYEGTSNAFLFSFPFFVFAARYEASPRDTIWGIQDSHGTQSSSLFYCTFQSLFRIAIVVMRDCSRMRPINSYQYLLLRILKQTPFAHAAFQLSTRSMSLSAGPSQCLNKMTTKKFFPVKRERNEARAHNELD